MGDIDEELLEDLYSWVDSIPLSRPKKDIRRDFSDGGTRNYCTVLNPLLYSTSYYNFS